MIYRLHNGSALSKVFGEHVSHVAGIGGCLFFDQELCHGLRSVLIFKSSLTAEIFNQSEFLHVSKPPRSALLGSSSDDANNQCTLYCRLFVKSNPIQNS